MAKSHRGVKCAVPKATAHFIWGEILLYLGGRDTKENSGDSKIIPLNITISKAAESASTKGFVNAVAMCASLSRHLPGNADKGPLLACQGHWKISTEFNT